MHRTLLPRSYLGALDVIAMNNNFMLEEVEGPRGTSPQTSCQSLELHIYNATNNLHDEVITAPESDLNNSPSNYPRGCSRAMLQGKISPEISRPPVPSWKPTWLFEGTTEWTGGNFHFLKGQARGLTRCFGTLSTTNPFKPRKPNSLVGACSQPAMADGFPSVLRSHAIFRYFGLGYLDYTMTASSIYLQKKSEALEMHQGMDVYLANAAKI
ncbi:predicted protein [Histoplasma capsulatum G186AR]|uniref:Uncharacterized protein n=1 Tax=Ajellomyces capsulatus (strain G186AR / H82 / ATCC MYA-2454 / RMSCC 2432) TaxID=447093 RepID=C0NFM7_AJECG|nr:uncharacterized protein HCBG_01693 [Histoplasma capsulatum G186AR]EEH10048.1 predicted protein [Histoplasma capsulatum G186AR]